MHRPMTRLHVSLFVLLLVAAAVFGPNTAGQPSFASSAADECGRPSQVEALAIQRAVDAYMTVRYPQIYGSAEVYRVVGDWALVVVLPKVPADRAALILRRTGPQAWSVVAGPGTAFPPNSRPAGMPATLLEPAPCG